MLGQIIVDAHRGFQRVARTISDWWKAAEDHPAYQAVRSRRAYDRFQADMRAKKAAVRAKHGRVREIERAQREALHNALAGGRR